MDEAKCNRAMCRYLRQAAAAMLLPPPETLKASKCVASFVLLRSAEHPLFETNSCSGNLGELPKRHEGSDMHPAVLSSAFSAMISSATIVQYILYHVAGAHYIA